MSDPSDTADMFADRIPSRSRCRAPQSSTSLLSEQLRPTCTRGHDRRRNRERRQSGQAAFATCASHTGRHNGHSFKKGVGASMQNQSEI